MGDQRTLMSDIMEEMDPELLAFIRRHVTSFTRWDLIRFYAENPNTQDTGGNLARYVGRSLEQVVQALEELAAEGILRAVEVGGQTVYVLADDPVVRVRIAQLVEAARDRTFRMKLVYHILRAGGAA